MSKCVGYLQVFRSKLWVGCAVSNAYNRHEGPAPLFLLDAVRSLIEISPDVTEEGMCTWQHQMGPWAETNRLFVAPVSPINIRDTTTMNELIDRTTVGLTTVMHDRAFFNTTNGDLSFAVNYFDELLGRPQESSDDADPQRRSWVVLYPNQALAVYAYAEQCRLNELFIAGGEQHPLAYQSPLQHSVNISFAANFLPSDATKAAQGHRNRLNFIWQAANRLRNL